MITEIVRDLLQKLGAEKMDDENKNLDYEFINST
jgi:hypothetical protein